MEAIYVSIWDGGIEIRSECFIDLETNDVTDIEQFDVEGLDYCEEEYVELPDGEIIEEFTIDGEEI